MPVSLLPQSQLIVGLAQQVIAITLIRQIKFLNTKCPASTKEANLGPLLLSNTVKAFQCRYGSLCPLSQLVAASLFAEESSSNFATSSNFSMSVDHFAYDLPPSTASSASSSWLFRFPLLKTSRPVAR